MKWIKGYLDLVNEAKWGLSNLQSKDHKRMQDLLLVAILKGDIETCKSLIEDGVNLNAPYDKLNTVDYPLITAVLFGKDEILKLFLDSGADPNLQSRPGGMTALMHAVLKGKKGMAKMLVSAGADPNIIDKTKPMLKDPILRDAVREGDTEMVKILLDGNADPNASYTIMNNALYEVIDRGNNEILRILLDAGADPNILIGHIKESPLEFIMRYYKYQKDIGKFIPEVLESARLLISAGANVKNIFSSLEELEEILGDTSSWYSGGRETLARKIKASEIRKKLF